MRILILAFACASTLSGCAALTAAPWPTEGTGGFAELLPIDDDRIEALRDRVESFRERGAATAAAAEFASADLLLVRVRREVAAGVPRRMPDVIIGLCGSKGMPFLLQVICARPSAASAALPVRPLGVRSTSIRWLSVPPVTSL